MGKIDIADGYELEYLQERLESYRVLDTGDPNELKYEERRFCIADLSRSVGNISMADHRGGNGALIEYNNELHYFGSTVYRSDGSGKVGVGHIVWDGNQWKGGGAPHGSLYMSSFANHEGRLYVVGGCTYQTSSYNFTITNGVWSYNGRSWVKKFSFPAYMTNGRDRQYRVSPHAVSFKGELHLLGVYSKYTGSYNSSSEVVYFENHYKWNGFSLTLVGTVPGIEGTTTTPDSYKVIVRNGKLYKLGSGGNYCYDGSSWTSSDISAPYTSGDYYGGSSLAVYGEKMCNLGPRDTSISVYKDGAWTSLYNTKLGTASNQDFFLTIGFHLGNLHAVYSNSSWYWSHLIINDDNTSTQKNKDSSLALLDNYDKTQYTGKLFRKHYLLKNNIIECDNSNIEILNKEDVEEIPEGYRVLHNADIYLVAKDNKNINYNIM